MQDFPWFPKPVNPLTGATAGDINEFPSLIWFNKDKNAAEGAKTTLKPIAEKWIAAAEKEECDDVRFFYYSEDDDDDDIGSSLKSFASVGEATLVLIDIPSQKVCGYVCVCVCVCWGPWGEGLAGWLAGGRVV